MSSGSGSDTESNDEATPVTTNEISVTATTTTTLEGSAAVTGETTEPASKIPDPHVVVAVESVNTTPQQPDDAGGKAVEKSDATASATLSDALDATRPAGSALNDVAVALVDAAFGTDAAANAAPTDTSKTKPRRNSHTSHHRRSGGYAHKGSHAHPSGGGHGHSHPSHKPKRRSKKLPQEQISLLDAATADAAIPASTTSNNLGEEVPVILSKSQHGKSSHHSHHRKPKGHTTHTESPELAVSATPPSVIDSSPVSSPLSAAAPQKSVWKAVREKPRKIIVNLADLSSKEQMAVFLSRTGVFSATKPSPTLSLIDGLPKPSTTDTKVLCAADSPRPLVGDILIMGECGITAASAGALASVIASLSSTRAIEVLDLARNAEIGDPGVSAICSALLSRWGNKVGAGYGLSSCAHVPHLSFCGCKAAGSSAAAIAAIALPGGASSSEEDSDTGQADRSICACAQAINVSGCGEGLLVHLPTCQQVVRVSMFGGGGVGSKSSLAVRFSKGFFIRDYDPTIEDFYRGCLILNGIVYNILITDTAGQDEYTEMRKKHIKRTDVFILGYAITSHYSFLEIKQYHKEICEELGLGEEKIPQSTTPGLLNKTLRKPAPKSSQQPLLPTADTPTLPEKVFPCILVGGKCDLSAEREVSQEEGMALSEKLHCPFYEVSSKTGDNVEQVFTQAVKMFIHNIGAKTAPAKSPLPETAFSFPIPPISTLSTYITDEALEIKSGDSGILSSHRQHQTTSVTSTVPAEQPDMKSALERISSLEKKVAELQAIVDSKTASEQNLQQENQQLKAQLERLRSGPVPDLLL
ncbi:Protein ras-2 [Pelomyxa schiedti]|nr:Protein ras-2 [Pelomyxa schiedti]